MDVVTNIQKQMTSKHDEKEDSILKQQLEEKQAEIARLMAENEKILQKTEQIGH